MYKHRKNEKNKKILLYSHEYDLITMCIRDECEFLHSIKLSLQEEDRKLTISMIETLRSLSAVLEDRWYSPKETDWKGDPI